MALSSILGHAAATTLFSAIDTFTTAPSSVVYPESLDPTSAYTPCYGTPLGSSFATDVPNAQEILSGDWERLPDWRCGPGDGIDSFQTGWNLQYRDRLLRDLDRLKFLQQVAPERYWLYIRRMSSWAGNVHTGGATQIAEWYRSKIFDALNRAEYPKNHALYLPPDLFAIRCWDIVRLVNFQLENYDEPAPTLPIPTNGATGIYGLQDDPFSVACAAAAAVAGAIANAI